MFSLQTYLHIFGEQIVRMDGDRGEVDDLFELKDDGQVAAIVAPSHPFVAIVHLVIVVTLDAIGELAQALLQLSAEAVQSAIVGEIAQISEGAISGPVEHRVSDRQPMSTAAAIDLETKARRSLVGGIRHHPHTIDAHERMSKVDSVLGVGVGVTL